MLKIGQNWGKIANYPPQCSTKICTPVGPYFCLQQYITITGYRTVRFRGNHKHSSKSFFWQK